MFNTCGRRCFSEKLDAKLLSSLRKQTGYGISLCRDALRESNNDIKLARAWLDEQAIKKGWQKAEKLQGRKTGEGLIGIMVEDNHAAMVEVDGSLCSNLPNITFFLSELRILHGV